MTIISLEQKDDEEIHSLQQQVKLLKNLLKSSQSNTELQQERAEKQKATEEIAALHAQFIVLKQKLAEMQQQQKESYREKNQFKIRQEQLEEELKQYSTNTATTIKQALEETEVRLTVAQQHLAKKVREVALLNETIDEQSLQLRSVHKEIDALHDHVEDLKANLLREQQLQLELKGAVQAAELLGISWEEKYHRLYHTAQESEQQIRELKLVEDKYRQMQSLWTSFNHFLNESPSATENLQPPVSKRPYQNLFDLSKL